MKKLVENLEPLFSPISYQDPDTTYMPAAQWEDRAHQTAQALKPKREQVFSGGAEPVARVLAAAMEILDQM